MRVVEKADRDGMEPWCKECRHFYWHADDCNTGRTEPGHVSGQCPTCGSFVVSPEAWQRITDEIENPSPPSPALIAIFKERG